jgi:hypothetical protein
VGSPLESSRRLVDKCASVDGFGVQFGQQPFH